MGVCWVDNAKNLRLSNPYSLLALPLLRVMHYSSIG